jgi:hypothetical protein
MDALFTEIETFEHHFDWLVASKLPKIFKHISMLQGDIPQEDEFRFRQRAHALVESWKVLFFASHPSEPASTSTKEDKAETHGGMGKMAPFKIEPPSLAPLKLNASTLSTTNGSSVHTSSPDASHRQEQTSDERSHSKAAAPDFPSHASDSSSKSSEAPSTRSEPSVQGFQVSFTFA